MQYGAGMAGSTEHEALSVPFMRLALTWQFLPSSLLYWAESICCADAKILDNFCFTIHQFGSLRQRPKWSSRFGMVCHRQTNQGDTGWSWMPLVSTSLYTMQTWLVHTWHTRQRKTRHLKELKNKQNKINDNNKHIATKRKRVGNTNNENKTTASILTASTCSEGTDWGTAALVHRVWLCPASGQQAIPWEHHKIQGEWKWPSGTEYKQYGLLLPHLTLALQEYIVCVRNGNRNQRCLET